MAIEEQLKETRVLKNLTVNSRQELLNAQDNLQKYLSNNDKKFLELYFQSLRKLTGNIDSIRTYENTNPSLKKTIDSRREEISKLNSLETFIDSIYKKSQKPSHKSAPLKIKNLTLKIIPKNLI